jgi:hypothetical protein
VTTIVHSESTFTRGVALFTAASFLHLALSATLPQGMWSSEAHAQEGRERRVAVFLLPSKASQKDDAQVLQTLLREEVGKLAGVRGLTGSPEPNKSLAMLVGQSLEDAIRALNDRDAAKAQVILTDIYEKLIRYTGAMDKRMLARVLKARGVAFAMSDQLKQAQTMVRASLNLWPEQRPAEYGYSLDVLQTYKGVERMRAEESTGGLAVVTEPEGAEVSIDGTVVGYAPLKKSDLPPGLHWVQVSLDGYVRSGSFIDIAAGEEAAHRVSLKGRANQEAWKKVVGGLPRAFKSKSAAGVTLPALVSMLEADEVLVLRATPKRSGYMISGWYQSTSALNTVRLTLKRDANFIGNLQSWLQSTLIAEAGASAESLALDAPPQAAVMAVAEEDDDLFIDPNDPILKTKSTVARKSITDEWWFWTAVGGVATALTVGAVVLFTGEEEGTGPVGSVSIDLYKVNED